MQNEIIKSIDLKCPVDRVWRAIKDYREFGEWFRVKIDGPFIAGQNSHGNILCKGYEHLRWNVSVKEIVPQSLFSFTWHPYAVDPNVDYSLESPTLVEFRLEKIADGTRLTVTESGFGKLPQHRYAEVMRMNEQGWTQQMKNIENHVVSSAQLSS